MAKDIYQATKKRRSYYNIDDQKVVPVEEPDEKEYEPLEERIEVYK